ncbi:amidohydrolase family protein [Polynucleobacter ibericus]|uniref:amidohydrolase family protein n=1 Tax=Polynucleobacter ibericus TaxID=1819725 RepID=UPI001BFE6DED|nr:amidohydrolase family protein [Polynucleobacter ibericus]QWE08152.1 amidohydrolase family protein [Polynucleobacter ibericus]
MTNTNFDLVICNGHIVDPDSGWDGLGNVGVNQGKIAAISKDPLKGVKTIDATGLFVAPGFIDLHAHGQFTSANWMQAFDGVTTALELELGMLPIAQYYENLQKEGRPLNYGASASCVMARVSAFEKEVPQPTLGWALESMDKSDWQYDIATADQLKTILSEVEQGLKDGGIGIGVNAGYAPGLGYKEYYQLAELAKKYDVPTFTHVRYFSTSEPESTFQAIEELIGLSFNPGAHMHICHLNSVSMRDIGDIENMVSEAKKNGANISVEAYPYGAFSTVVGAAFLMLPNWAERLGGLQANDIEYNGLPLNDNSLPAMQKADPGNIIVCHFLRPETNPQDADDLAKSVLFPGGAIASDAMPWMTSGPDVKVPTFIEEGVWPLPDDAYSHPRSCGTFARFIKMYVRDAKSIPLLEAIRKTSLIPAQILEKSTPQMTQKGRLKVGADADIVVFDLNQVEDRGTFVKPNQVSTGMVHVIVNGTLLIENGNLDVKVRPGRPVRRPIAA